MDKMNWGLHLLSNKFLHIREVFNMLPQIFSKQEIFMFLTKKDIYTSRQERGSALMFGSALCLSGKVAKYQEI